MTVGAQGPPRLSGREGRSGPPRGCWLARCALNPVGLPATFLPGTPALPNHVSTPVHTQVHARTHVHTPTHLCTCPHGHAHTRTHAHASTRLCTCTHAPAHLNTPVYVPHGQVRGHVHPGLTYPRALTHVRTHTHCAHPGPPVGGHTQAQAGFPCRCQPFPLGGDAGDGTRALSGRSQAGTWWALGVGGSSDPSGTHREAPGSVHLNHAAQQALAVGRDEVRHVEHASLHLLQQLPQVVVVEGQRPLPAGDWGHLGRGAQGQRRGG